MSDKVLIKNKEYLYEINPKELLNSFTHENENEKEMNLTPPIVLKGLKYVKKTGQIQVSFCFEFENLSKDISVRLPKNSIKYISYDINRIESCLKSIISSESLNMLKDHLIKRQSSYQQYLNSGTELQDGYYYVFKLPVNFYHKVFLYGTIKSPSNPNSQCEFQILSKFSKHERVIYSKDGNRIILPNIYSGNNLCLGSNALENYDYVYKYREILEVFKNNLFNRDLNKTHNIISVKKSLKYNLKYIIKHKIKDENLKNAYVELFQKEEAILNILRLNENLNVYKFLNLFYLFDTE